RTNIAAYKARGGVSLGRRLGVKRRAESHRRGFATGVSDYVVGSTERIEGSGEAHSLHSGIAVPQKFIGSVLDPLGHVGICRTAIGRVVLEPAILRRVVRGGDDNAVGEMLGAGAVVDQDGARDDWGRCEAVVSLDDGLHLVGRQYFERGALGRSGNCMGVLPHVERAIGAMGAPVVADGLSD